VTDTLIGGAYVGPYSDLNQIIQTNADSAANSDLQNIRIPVYLYYMNFVHNLREVDSMPSNVCTLFIMPTIQSSNLYTTISDTVAVNITDINVTLKTPTGYYAVGRSLTPGSIVVVTLSTSMVLMTSMDAGNGDVEMLRVDSQPIAVFSVEDMRRVVSSFGPPMNIFPYTNMCIPNLADIALRLQILRG